MKRSKPRVAKPRRGARRPSQPPGTFAGSLKIPSILLEGDESEPAPAGVPEQKHHLESSTVSAQPPGEPRELPEAHGTGRMLLLARDPHCLYAHWDLTSAQLRQYEERSADAHLVVRCHRDEAAGPLAAEFPMPAGMRHGFLSVPNAGVSYVVELGYYLASRQWVPVAVSGRATTPHETVSEDRTVEFARVPSWAPRPASTPSVAKSPAGDLLAGVGSLEASAASGSAAGLRPPPRVGWIPILGVGSTAPAPHERGETVSQEASYREWTLAQKQALAELLGLDLTTPGAMSSLELTRGWDDLG